MLTLDSLLGLAAKGWAIFPLAPYSKIPAKGSHGVSDATTDPDVITSWYKACPSANYGVNCGKSGLIVIDADLYKDGCKAAVAALDFDYGFPETFTVQTPGGGTHWYFSGSGRNSVEKLGRGIDSRGTGGYVVIAGSTTADGEYEVAKNIEIAAAPEWLLSKLSLPPESSTVNKPSQVMVALDSPSAITAATAYLSQAAPEAVEGSGGDATTLRVAMRVKDLGVNEDTAFTLMAQYYNPRCSPEWDLDELRRKVSNAFTYGKTAPGSASLEAAGFQPVEGHVPAEPMARRASTFDVSKLRPRPWLLGHDMMSGFLTATIAQGGVGKSMIGLIESMAIATGKPLSGVPVHKQGAAWIYNTEDPMEELERRVLASAAHYQLSRAELEHLHISSGRMNPLTIGKSERGVVTINNAMIDAVGAYIREHNILAWSVDPFVHSHYCDENSNSEMAAILLAFSKISEQTGVAINLTHHTSKGSADAGDMEKARGASAFGGAVRIMRHVQTMSDDKCGLWGIGKRERKSYIGLYEAKGNMSPSTDDIRWFKKISVLLPNTDNVGVVEPVTLEQIDVEDLTPVREAVFARVQADQYTDGELQMLEEVAGDLKSCEKDLNIKLGTKATLRRQIRECFEGGAVHVPGTLKRVRYLDKGGKSGIIIEASVGEWND